MKAPMPEPKIIDKADSIIGALESLKSSVGWAIIKKILNDNIEYLEKAIIDKVDPITKDYLSDKDIELLRIKRSLNINLRDTPLNYAKQIETTGEVPEDFDPYFKSNNEIIDMRRRERKDDGQM